MTCFQHDHARKCKFWWNCNRSKLPARRESHGATTYGSHHVPTGPGLPSPMPCCSVSEGQAAAMEADRACRQRSLRARGKASVKTNRSWGLLAWSSWLPRSLNFTNGWTSEEVLCKSTLQWCSFHFLRVRALNFGYTLFKISWQCLIKVLSKRGSKQSSGLQNS